MLETIWKMKPVSQQAVSELAFDLSLPRPVATLLVQRGLDTKESVRQFCRVSAEKLHNPFCLPDIEPVLERLHRALDTGEKLFVWGDYDVDGVTATTVVVRVLTMLGARFDFEVPHRMEDGYDLKPATVDKAIAAGASLMLSVDCGIVAFQAANYAKEKGIDLIITDHHTPSGDGRLPDCIGVVNPNRADSSYPFSGLAGVGIAFKVMIALAVERGLSAHEVMEEVLEFVALGTVADVAPMIDENRTLVSLGCEKLTTTRKAGVQALLKVAGVKDVNTTSIGFFLGPRINAIGRLADADTALKLLLERSETRAAYIAEQLNVANKRRQELQEQMVKEAKALLPEDMSETYAIVLSAHGWHKCLVGLVASRLVEEYGRPAIVLSVKNNDPEDDYNAGGSCRSPHTFHLLNALKSPEIWELFTRREDGSVICGGHAVAAGLTIPARNIPLLKERLNTYAREKMGEEPPARVLEIDALMMPADINETTLEKMLKLAPFGSENPEPLFLTKNMRIVKSETLSNGKHLKMQLTGADGKGPWVSALVWRRGQDAETFCEGAQVDVVYQLSVEEFRGRRNLTMTVRDLRRVA